MTFLSGSFVRTIVLTEGTAVYSASAGSTGLYIQCVGGGGGGGNSNATKPSAGGGGGGGAYTEFFYDITETGDSLAYAVNVGAGGAAGAAGGITWISASSDALICAASGGAAGGTAPAAGAAAGGAGGTVTGVAGEVSGTLVIPGGPGSAGFVAEWGAPQRNTIRRGGFTQIAGRGGSSAGSVGGTYGAGGTGGVNGYNGGAGNAGFLRIAEYSSGSV